MNKTVYLPEDEADTWEKARRLANDRLSPVILRALKDYIMTKEAEAAGFERIELEFDDTDDNYLPKRKAFRGRWIFSPESPFREESFLTDRDASVYAIAVTPKGSVVVYMWLEPNDLPSGPAHQYNHRFLVFRSFEEAAQDHDVRLPVREAVRKRGVPVEDLDI